MRREDDGWRADMPATLCTGETGRAALSLLLAAGLDVLWEEVFLGGIHGGGANTEGAREERRAV